MFTPSTVNGNYIQICRLGMWPKVIFTTITCFTTIFYIFHFHERKFNLIRCLSHLAFPLGIKLNIFHLLCVALWLQWITLIIFYNFMSHDSTILYLDSKDVSRLEKSAISRSLHSLQMLFFKYHLKLTKNKMKKNEWLCNENYLWHLRTFPPH